MVSRAGAKEWILLQSAAAPVAVPSTSHCSCSCWGLALAGCHAFSHQCSEERLHSHKHNLVHSELLPSLLSVSLLPHMSIINFTSYSDGILAYLQLSAGHLVFPCAWSLWGSSSAALCSSAAYIFCLLFGRKDNTNCLQGHPYIPVWRFWDSLYCCVVKGKALYRNVNML